MIEREVRSITADLPSYQDVIHFLRIMNNTPYIVYRSMYDEIWSQRGTPQEQMDWSDPDKWIPERLSGDDRIFAYRIWRESDNELNPRYLRGCWGFSNRHRLLHQDSSGAMLITERGLRFTAETASELVMQIDSYEGLLTVLEAVKKHGSGRYRDLLPYYSAFCHQYSRYRSDSPIKGSLRDRLNNLIARDLVSRRGHMYVITDHGNRYLHRSKEIVGLPVVEVSSSETSDTETPDIVDTLTEIRSLTPGLPIYDKARHFLRLMDEVPYALYRSTYDEIWSQRGSPQEQVDWVDPDEWIPKRLSDNERELAMKIWRGSRGELNPRYLRGCWYLTTKHNLLREDNSRTLGITEPGQRFLDKTDDQVIAHIDSYEGVLTILRLVADRGPGKRTLFLPEYAEFCRTYTGYRSDTPIRGSLYDRLVNLIERDLVMRSGQAYEITDRGLLYLEKFAHLIPGQPERTRGKLSELRKLTKSIQREVRDQLAEYLGDMDPFKFEELIKFLLEEMGYSDVETTSPTNDKGVDVVADIELGISSVREVVQVKRHRSNINRTVLDQLRGSLHRFNAVRGTIITTGGFSRGTKEAAFEPGAAPITLIDVEKLLDLFIEFEIGVSKQAVDYLEFDSTKLSQFESKEGEELQP